jgi:CBS domain containing-hemolysin-like protein
MVMAEMVPRNLTFAAPERILTVLAPINRPLTALARPVTWLLNRAAAATVRPFGLRPATEITTAHTAAEFARMVDASHNEGLLEEFEHSLLAGVLDFRQRPVSSVMVARGQVVAVERSMPVGDVEQLADRTGFSRFPVVDTTVDHLLGFIHVKDLLRLPPEAVDEPLPLDLVRRMLVVPPDRKLEDLLRTMRRLRSHLAAVQDPTGRLLGIVSLEDVLEELVGDMNDESDRA